MRKRSTTLVLILYLALSSPDGSGQTFNSPSPMTPAQAQKEAQTLLGKRPDRADSYVSEEDKISFVAFSSETPALWVQAEKTQKQGYEEVWIYEQVPGSAGLRQVWYERNLWPGLNFWSIEGFAKLPGEKAPSLRLRASWHGATGCGGTRLGLYSLAQNRFFWIDYQQDCEATGMPKLRISEKDAVGDPSFLNYLRTWGHEEDQRGNLRAHLLNGELAQFEQLWIDANGQRPCPSDWATSSLAAWKSSRIGRLMPYRSRELYGKPTVVLEDGRYQWLSYFKGGVGVYNSQAHQYSLVYLPAGNYDWSQKLVVIGPWLYIQDCLDHWAVRFNKATRMIERGDFDDTVGSLDTGVYLATRSNNATAALPAEKKDATVPVIHPYDLVKNPFAYRGSEVRFDVGSWPYVLNGQVYQWVPIAGSAWGGIQFQRMLTENEALYDVRGLDMNGAASELTTMGQLVVFVPRSSSQLDPGRRWLVKPLGVETGTNIFGALIQTPKVQFLRYAVE